MLTLGSCFQNFPEATIHSLFRLDLWDLIQNQKASSAYYSKLYILYSKICLVLFNPELVQKETFPGDFNPTAGLVPTLFLNRTVVNTPWHCLAIALLERYFKEKHWTWTSVRGINVDLAWSISTIRRMNADSCRTVSHVKICSFYFRHLSRKIQSRKALRDPSVSQVVWLIWTCMGLHRCYVKSDKSRRAAVPLWCLSRFGKHGEQDLLRV